MTYTKKIAYNTIAQMVGKVAGIGISLVTVAAIFRSFGVEGVGKYTTIFAFVAFFSIFADFGLQWTLIRELSIAPIRDREKLKRKGKDDESFSSGAVGANENISNGASKDKVFKNIFTFRLILALIVHAVAFGAVWLFKYPLDVKLGVGIITAAWFFATVNSTLVGVFLNNYRLDITVATEFVGRICILVLVLLVTKAGMPLNMVLIAYLFGNAVNFLINFIIVGRYVEVGLAFDKKYWRYAIAQAFPIGVVLVFGFIYYKVDSLMLSLMKGMIDVGIYGTAYKILEILQYIPVMFLGVAFPLITKYAVTGDERIKSAFQKQFDFLIILAVPVVVTTFILASPIIEFIAGSRGGEFVNSSTVSFLGYSITSVTCLKILIISVGISFVSNLYAYLIVSLGRQKNMVLPTILLAILNVILNLMLIPRFSYLGSAIATLITEVAVCTTCYLVSRKYISLPILKINFAKILVAGAGSGILIYIEAMAGLNLFVILSSGICLYTALIFVFKVISVGMVRDILKN